MTLIEMLIVVAISALVMIALMSLYMAGQKYFFNQNSRADTIEESRMPMAWISRDIRDADQVHNGAVTADGATYSTGANCLVLEVPSIDATGLIVTGHTDYIVYAYDQTHRTLRRVVEPDAAHSTRHAANRILAEDLVSDGAGGLPFKLKYLGSDGVTELTGTYDNAFIVEVELTSQGRSVDRRSQPFTETVRTQAKLRNKNIPY
jgi:Tfp pilus assembly protein PilW